MGRAGGGGGGGHVPNKNNSNAVVAYSFFMYVHFAIETEKKSLFSS
jgi:hypothetical protein